MLPDGVEIWIDTRQARELGTDILLAAEAADGVLP
jgi:hypothetical protein